MNKWKILLIGLPLLLGTSLGAGLAWAGDRTDTPDGGYEEPPGDPPVRSDDDVVGLTSGLPPGIHATMVSPSRVT